MYVYKRTEFSPYCLYTVGFYEPNGNWIPEKDYTSADEAAERVAWLNGSRPTLPDEIKKAINEDDNSRKY